MKYPCLAVICLLGVFSSASTSFAETSFYVSTSGRADGSGSWWHPFATLEQARDAVRTAKKANAKQSFTVIVKDGVYLLTDSFKLAEEDSGTETYPVIYKASKQGGAKLYGGALLDKKNFKSITDEKILARLQSEARKHVLVCDVSQELKGDLPQIPLAYHGAVTPPFLYVDGQPKTIARWPNKGEWATFCTVVDPGREKQPGAFEFKDARIAKWNMADGVWMHGYWTHDWSDEVLKVASYEADQGVVRLAARHGYGLMAGTWGKKERRFYALNVLEELDAPGEWYLDRKAKLLFYYPEPNAKHKEIVLATLQNPLLVAKRVKHVQIQGLTFAYNHGEGLNLQDCTSMTIVGCAVRNVARNAISVQGSNNRVQSCDIFDIGASGIVLNGGDRQTLVKGNNVAENNHVYRFGQFSRTYAGAFGVQGCGNVVRNNVMHDAPHTAILYGGNEQLIELNEVYNVQQETGDVGAFYTGRDWTSQGNVVRYNYFHDLGGGGQGQNEHLMGIYLDDCDSGDTLHGNLFQRAGRALFIGGGRDNTVTCNLVMDSMISFHFDSRGMSWKNWNQPGEGWNLEERAEKMNYKNPPWSTRYPRLAETMNNSPREPLGNVLKNNLLIDSKSQALSFDKQVREVFPKLISERNRVVDTVGTNKASQLSSELKGFEGDVAKAGQPIDLGLPNRDILQFKKSAAIMRMMPALAEIPAEKIGLYVDAFRKTKSTR
jgi:hypothetical protein